jgi:hypothetical protein
MFKKIFILILSSHFFFTSCHFQQDQDKEEDSLEVGETFNETDVPTLAYYFEANVDFFKTTPQEEEKFEEAIRIIKQVVTSLEFKERVLNHTYNGVKTFVDNKGLSNAQIYRVILEGAETLNKVKNNTMDMEVELYYADTSTVGYTTLNSPRIWVNKKYFYTFSVSGVASNLMHEWLHKLGFRHESTYSPSRDYSVPYAIGRIVRSLGRGL